MSVKLEQDLHEQGVLKSYKNACEFFLVKSVIRTYFHVAEPALGLKSHSLSIGNN